MGIMIGFVLLVTGLRLSLEFDKINDLKLILNQNSQIL